ncbi:hypothetical protein TWF694_005217 [Orbilia ellipsospora]|uniref:DUF7029 domain-containing protein n=1 Tax=Orbilia ellipsospora TaxID=2528407 RepID=A0AAV9WW70_9PEZI
MHTRYSLLTGVVALLANNVDAAGCNADNVLRALRGKASDAINFCQTYTLSAATAGQSYPAYISQYSTAASRVSSACTCLVAAATTAATTMSTTTTAAPSSACNADNVLRALRGSSSSAVAFCNTYTLSAATAGQSYPAYISQYSASASRISSACTCLATGATTTTSSDPWFDPSPTVTKTDNSYHEATPVGTVTGLTIPIQTGSVEDSIPPAPAKAAFHGALVGENSEKVFIAVTNMTAKPEWPLVKLDDILPGLNGASPIVCGSETITLTFSDASYYNLALKSWASQFILITSGDCGNNNEMTLFKSSIKSSGANAIVLNAVATEIKDALAGLDTGFGHLPNPTLAQNRKRNIQKRNSFTDFWSGLWGDIKDVAVSAVKYIEKIGDLTKVTTVAWHMDAVWNSANLVLFDKVDVSCSHCGLVTDADVFGQVNVDFENLSETGILLGLEFTNPELTLDVSIDIIGATSTSGEYVFASAPIFYAITIPNILDIGPLIQLVAAVELTTDTGFAWQDIGLTAQWSGLQMGYNFITKQPFLGGSLIPSVTGNKGHFGSDFGITAIQEIDLEIWAGPRAKFGVTVCNTFDASADITFKLPSLHVTGTPKDAVSCGGVAGRDICVNVATSLEVSLNADFEAGVKDIVGLGAGFTIWHQQVPGTVYSGDFLIEYPQIAPGTK